MEVGLWNLFFWTSYFVRLWTGSQTQGISWCIPCVNTPCGPSWICNHYRGSGWFPLRQRHCVWMWKEKHHPKQLVLSRHKLFWQFYRSPREWYTVVTLEVLMICNFRLIGLGMVKRQILGLVILEVEYFWCFLNLAHRYIELIHGYLAGRSHELGLSCFEVNHS